MTELPSLPKPALMQRITSIDILRALTMVLMIFVNDLWSLKNIPGWLEHVEHGVDGIGLSDVVFPAFLFIVGLSLPFAMENRRKKGDTEWQLVTHVLLRTIALLVMGVFLVTLFFSHFVSLGSILGSLAFATTLALVAPGGWRSPTFGFGVLIALVVIIRHHENIGRLMKGTERPFHFRKPKGAAS